MDKEILEILKDLEAFRSEKKNCEIDYMSQYGKVNKRLAMTLNGTYRVYHNKTLILETMQPYNAVEKYLSIKAK